ncbi:MAG: MCE family protein [Verrucomicrobia bacterium]|jgi:phospholipid/cholesterol/gamma-HCH transport system substrate-binding protein|nr:MCE family protein [Verrucomicrobiota bacterium]
MSAANKTLPSQSTSVSPKNNRLDGSSEAQVGLFIIVALIAAFVLMEVAGSVNFFSETVTVDTRFDNIKDLKKGDPVKVAGVQVGRVDTIAFDSNKVRVRLLIDQDKQSAIRTDSEASIQFEGLMGQHYVAVQFGESGLPIESGTVLTTREQPDLSTLMAKLDGVAAGVENMTSSFSGDTFGDILGPLGDLIQENKDKFTIMLSNFELVSDQIAKGEGTIGKLISDPEFYESATATVIKLQNTADEINLAVQEARNIVTRLNEGNGTLGKLTTDDTLYKESTVAMNNLKEILVKLNRGEGSIGMLINDPALLNNATTTLQKVNKATESLEDQGPMSVIGMAVGNLF